jgi:hypothetical protein
MFVCGGYRTRTARLKHKNVTSKLQQKRTFHLYGIESPHLYTVTRSAELPHFSDSRTFYLKQERRTAFCHLIFSSYF